ncbi:MAG: MarR family transcriptional regulator [bacterium]|nr:MarR family transcriptional regulator [bacterium]
MENLEEIIFYSLENAIKSYRQFAQRNITASGIGITIDQWLIMKAISENAEATQTEIADKVFKDTASLTRMIDLLIKKEYILRKTHGNDRRRTELRLTNEGKKVLTRIQVIIKKNRSQALTGISQIKINETRKVLSTIITNCKAK